MSRKIYVLRGVNLAMKEINTLFTNFMFYSLVSLQLVSKITLPDHINDKCIVDKNVFTICL